MELYGIKGTFIVNTGKEYVSGESLTTAYDFFETVMELAVEKAKWINVRVDEVKGTLRINITVDCPIQASDVKKEYPAAMVETDEEGTELYLPLTGGAK